MKNKNKNNNNEVELNELFDFEIPTEEDIIKKAKRKSYTKVIATSFGFLSLTLVLAAAAKVQIMPRIITNKIVALEIHNDIVGADGFIGMWDEENKILSSGATAPKYKVIGGKPVYTGEMDINKLNYETYYRTEDSDTLYSYFGHRIMKFYHPLVEYDKYSNDLANLDEVGANKNIEVALSFDKPYTLKEVKSMLPDDVTINWLWVDTFKGDNLEAIKKFDNGVTKTDAQVLEENNVVGFSTMKEDGVLKENPINDFIEDIKLGLSKGGQFKKDIKHIYDTLGGNDNTINENNIKIIGAVVVSDKEGLNKLKDISKIKSSSFGVINDKY